MYDRYLQDGFYSWFVLGTLHAVFVVSTFTFLGIPHSYAQISVVKSVRHPDSRCIPKTAIRAICQRSLGT